MKALLGFAATFLAVVGVYLISLHGWWVGPGSFMFGAGMQFWIRSEVDK